MAHRDHTRILKLGPLALGGGHPVLVQSMTNTDTRDVEATLRQLHALADAGCEIARLAVPDDRAAAALRVEGSAPEGLIMALFAVLGAGATCSFETAVFSPSISTS